MSAGAPMREDRSAACRNAQEALIPTEPVPVAQLWRDGVAQLRAAGIEHAQREVIWLLEEALGVSRPAIHADGTERVGGRAAEQARRLFARRAQHEPVQYLLGTQDFCGLTCEVTPAVLIPRPETELLVEETLRVCGSQRSARIVDVCTGSGCIAVAIARARPDAMLWATDLSQQAVDVARRNVSRNRVEARVTVLQGDLLAPLASAGVAGSADVIVSNPPYIAAWEWPTLPPDVAEFEPRLALDGGPDGLRAHRQIADLAPCWLRPGGWLILEIGQKQSVPLAEYLQASGAYGDAQVRQDFRGMDRVVSVQRKG